VAELLGDVGAMVPVGDTDALARAMLRTLATVDTASADRRVGRERIVTHFGIAAAADRWLALYHELSAPSRGHTGHAHPCAGA
jgi:glycosyltransferase involved in cell wall biosynthesis